MGLWSSALDDGVLVAAIVGREARSRRRRGVEARPEGRPEARQERWARVGLTEAWRSHRASSSRQRPVGKQRQEGVEVWPRVKTGVLRTIG